MRLVAVLLLACLALAQDKRFDYACKDTPLREVVAKVNAFFGIRLELGASVAARPVTLAFEGATAPQVLRKLEDVTKTRLERIGRGHYRLGGPDAEAIRRALETEKITFTVRGVEIARVFDVFHQMAHVPFALDAGVAGRVDLTAKGLSLKDALALVLEPQGLAYEIRCGFVCVAAPDRLPRFPALSPFALKRPGKGFAVSVTRRTLAETLDVLAAGSGVQIELDATVPPKFRGRSVSLYARETTLPDALAVLLVPMGHTVVETDAGLVVKAAK